MKIDEEIEPCFKNLEHKIETMEASYKQNQIKTNER